MGNIKTMDFIAKGSDAKSMEELENTVFVITAVEYNPVTVTNPQTKLSESVEGALITIEGKEGQYRTTSEVLVSQLKQIQETIISQGLGARVKLSRIKGGRGLRYYSFTNPNA